MSLLNVLPSYCMALMVGSLLSGPTLAKTNVTPIQTIDASSPFTFHQTVPDVPNAMDRRYVAVDTGGMATCAIRAVDRGIDCWGSNELGNSSPGTSGTKYRALSLGASVGCALTVGQRLSCWGLDAAPLDSGQARQRYVKVSTGFDHVCAIRTDNKAVECWVGSGQSLGALMPPRGAFRTISSGGHATCGVRSNKQLACWGDGSFVNIPRPTGLFTDVAVGNLHACAVRAGDGAVVCWGNNYYGENTPPPGRFKSVTTGKDHTCGLRQDQTVTCWGRNDQGQLDMPDTIKLTSLNAGGAQTCALDPDQHVVCRGSFGRSGLTNSTPVGGFNPIDNGIGILTNYLGGVFANWADGNDGLLLVGALFGLTVDKTKAQLQAIQKKLDEMNKTLQEVNKKSDSIIHDLKDLKCDGKLGALDDATRIINQAFNEYYGTGPLTDTGSYMKSVNEELANAQQPGYIPRDLRPGMRQFVTKYQKQVDDGLDSINRVLMNQNYLEGPMGDCLVKSFAAYRSSTGDKQIDDRRIWKGAYMILQKAMADQGKAAQMLLDMNKFTAVSSLSDPAALDSLSGGVYPSPVIPEGNGWHSASICEDVKGPPPQVNDRRWADAKNACENNEDVTRKLYRNLVQQVELTGAPYTNKGEILVMGSDLLGTGTMPTNYLWNRRTITYAKGGLNWGETGQVPSVRLASYLYPVGDNRIYWDREGDIVNKGTWRSDGQAWWDLFENVKGLPSYNQDRLGYMADTLSEFDGDPLINPSVKGKAFWMTGKTWNLDWNWVVMTAYSYEHWPRAFYSHGSPTMSGAKCFAGAVIGRICSDQELGAISLLDRAAPDGYWHMGIRNNTYHPEYNLTYEYLKNTIGGWGVIYWAYEHAAAHPPYIEYSYSSVATESAFWPWRDAGMNVMPVLDVSKRYCTPSMVLDNNGQGAPRQNYRNVTLNDSQPIALPSRCGTDLDYFIEQLLKRPNVPDLDKLVRKPVYPSGVN